MPLIIRSRLLSAIGCVLLAIPGLAGCNRDRSVQAAQEAAQPPNATPAEQDFMRKIAEMDLSDIDMARLALQKSANPEVRDFANMIQSDLTASLENLSSLMKDKGVSQPKIASPDARQDANRMAALTGAEFDREFVNLMVADDQKAVDMCRHLTGIAMDPGVKKYAEDLMPKLEMHLEKGQRLQSKLFRTTL
jgi:putative membrane protein